MNDIQIFKSEDFGNIRTTTINNEPYFVGKDVTDILGYSNSRDAISKHVDGEDRGVSECDTPGGIQKLTFINESGLYSLILSSKMPNAKKFKHWVTSEVLPNIRKHGAYMNEQTLEQALTSPDFLIRLAQELKSEKEARQKLEKQAAEDAPKVLFAKMVETAETSILIGDLAKFLKQNGINTGQNRLFEWMRGHGYLVKNGASRNMPTQRAMEMGLFEIKESTTANPDGTIRLHRTTKVTGKGQVYFMKRFSEMGV